MQRLELKAAHKPVQNYYAALRQFDDLGVTQVITVSIETVEVVKALPALDN